MISQAPARPISIQEALKQSKPFHSTGQEAYLALLRTADDMRRRVSMVLEPTGVTLQQYNVLRILRGAGEEGLPTLAIGERMIERTPGVTRLIDRMEERGWVTRVRCTEDRRRVWCRITEAGLRLIEPLDGPVNAVDDLLEEVLDQQQLESLIDQLDTIREHLDRTDS